MLSGWKLESCWNKSEVVLDAVLGTGCGWRHGRWGEWVWFGVGVVVGGATEEGGMGTHEGSEFGVLD